MHEAFWRLSPSRQAGMAIGPIPFSEVDRYAERYGVEDFDSFLVLIRAMDRVFIEHANRKSDAG